MSWTYAMITLKDDNSSTFIPSGQVLAIMIKLHTGDNVSYNKKNRQDQLYFYTGLFHHITSTWTSNYKCSLQCRTSLQN